MEVTKFIYPDLTQFPDRTSGKPGFRKPLASSDAPQQTEEKIETPQPEAPPPEPTITVKEHERILAENLDKAREEGKSSGHSEGYQKGLEEGRGEVKALEEQAIVLLEGVREKLNHFAVQLSDYQENYAKESTLLAREIARKVTADTLPAQAEAIIMATLEKALGFLREVPEITLFVNPSLTNNLQDKVQSLQKQGSKQPVNIVVLPDESLEATDCRVEWSNGILERNVKTVWERIDALYQDTIRTRGESAATAEPIASTDGEIQAPSEGITE